MAITRIEMSTLNCPVTKGNLEEKRLEVSAPASAHKSENSLGCLHVPGAIECAHIKQFDAVNTELQELLLEFKRRALFSSRLVSGAEKNICTLEQGIKEAGFWMKVGGTVSQMRKEISCYQELLASSKAELQSVSRIILRAEEEISHAGALFTEGQELSAKKSEKEAAAKYLSAQKSLGLLQDILHKELGVDSNQIALAKFDSRVDSVRNGYHAAIGRLDTTDTWLRRGRNACVYAGASLATGGAATAGYGTVAAVGIGVGTGTSIGAVSNTSEAASAVIVGVKEPGAAAKDAAINTAYDLKRAGIGATSAIFGASVNAQIATRLTYSVPAKASLVAGGSGCATRSASQLVLNSILP